MKEADLQKATIGLAHLLGWTVAHFRAAQTQSGRWVTPVAADGAGFPDLVLVRERVIFAELKSEKGVLSHGQVLWRDRLRRAGENWRLWRPADWLSGDIELELRRILAHKGEQKK